MVAKPDKNDKPWSKNYDRDFRVTSSRHSVFDLKIDESSIRSFLADRRNSMRRSKDATIFFTAVGYTDDGERITRRSRVVSLFEAVPEDALELLEVSRMVIETETDGEFATLVIFSATIIRTVKYTKPENLNPRHHRKRYRYKIGLKPKPKTKRKKSPKRKPKPKRKRNAKTAKTRRRTAKKLRRSRHRKPKKR